MKKFFQDFKKFISKGNVIDLAVGVIIGNAFSAIVKALTDKIIMPFINAKISKTITKEQETQIKTLLGEAITTIPGKSENWLMVGLEPEYTLYFRGDNTDPIAFVEVSVFGGENKAAFEKLTARICDIFQQVLSIAPDHVYVKYEAVSNWGWNGGNF